jgi:hypothetical protein
MRVGKAVLAGIVIWVVGIIWAMLTCGWLFNWVYTIPPRIWKDAASITSTSNTIGSGLLGLLIALIFVFVYAWLYKGIPGKGIKKGLTYAFIVWLVSAFSGMITMPFYMTISWVVVIYWILNGLVGNLIFGLILGAIYKEKEASAKKK